MLDYIKINRKKIIIEKRVEVLTTSDIRQELARLWLPYTLSTVQVACNFNTVMTCNLNTVDFNYLFNRLLIDITFKIQVIKKCSNYYLRYTSRRPVLGSVDRPRSSPPQELSSALSAVQADCLRLKLPLKR